MNVVGGRPRAYVGSVADVGLVVQKFGGTSVADAERMRAVADHVALTRRRGDRVVLVVSAMGKETDDLLRLASEVGGSSRAGREMDMLITAGERKATALMCLALHEKGVPAESYTGSQAGFITDTAHTNAKILEIRPDRLRKALEGDVVPVVGGAQGVSTDHDVTFLGRGGSDTTAVALAQALGADACELYTDVSGVFTADPRLVASAHRIDHITFDEMLEMCASGCPKPAMRSVEFARTHGVRLHVRSAFTWEPGTWITEEDPMEQAIVSGVVDDDSRGQADRQRGARPPRHRRPPLPHAGRRRHQRGHDRAERVRSRRDRHLVHPAPRGPGRRPAHRRGDRGRDRRDRRRPGHQDRPRQPGRGGHEVEPRAWPPPCSRCWPARGSTSR